MMVEREGPVGTTFVRRGTQGFLRHLHRMLRFISIGALALHRFRRQAQRREKSFFPQLEQNREDARTIHRR